LEQNKEKKEMVHCPDQINLPVIQVLPPVNVPPLEQPLERQLLWSAMWIFQRIQTAITARYYASEQTDEDLATALREERQAWDEAIVAWFA
jgi:hypothetical protein